MRSTTDECRGKRQFQSDTEGVDYLRSEGAKKRGIVPDQFEIYSCGCCGTYHARAKRV